MRLTEWTCHHRVVTVAIFMAVLAPAVWILSDEASTGNPVNVNRDASAEDAPASDITDPAARLGKSAASSKRSVSDWTLPGSRPREASSDVGSLIAQIKKACPGRLEAMVTAYDSNAASFDVEAWRQDRDAENARIAAVLAESSSADQLLTAAIISPDPEISTQRLTQALRIGRDDPTVLFVALSHCKRANVACGDADELAERWVRLEPENSEAWIELSTHRYRSGDVTGALAALQQAGATSETRTHWVESIELFLSSLQSTDPQSFADLASNAIGYVASLPASYKLQSDMCKTEAGRSEQWANACIAYGEVLTERDRTAMSASIGRSLQMIANEEQGRLEKKADLQRDAEAYRQRTSSAWSNPAAAIALADPELFAEYLSAFKQYGEVTAIEKTEERLREVLDEAPERVCRAYDDYIALQQQVR